MEIVFSEVNRQTIKAAHVNNGGPSLVPLFATKIFAEINAMKITHIRYLLLYAISVHFCASAADGGTTDDSMAVSPASKYAISDSDLTRLQKMGRGGDCAAAYKLGGYHMNVSLRFDEALEWMRIAAKCPLIRPKEDLIGLLIQLQAEPAAILEIDSLIKQIEEIDPSEAERIKRKVDDRRRPASPRRAK